MQFEDMTCRVAGSIDVTICAELIERLGVIMGFSKPPENLVDAHWSLIAPVIHRKVATGEIEDDGSIKVGIADLDLDAIEYSEVARLDAQHELANAERSAEAGVGRWFGDIPGDDIPW